MDSHCNEKKMILTEFKTAEQHFFLDENDLIQGEYKSFYESGKLRTHCIVKDNKLHGEDRRYDANGTLLRSRLLVDGEVVVDNATNLDKEEKLALTIKYNVRWVGHVSD